MDEIEKVIADAIALERVPVAHVIVQDLAKAIKAELFKELSIRNLIRDFCDVRDEEDKAARAAAIAQPAEETAPAVSG